MIKTLSQLNKRIENNNLFIVLPLERSGFEIPNQKKIIVQEEWLKNKLNEANKQEILHFTNLLKNKNTNYQIK